MSHKDVFEGRAGESPKESIPRLEAEIERLKAAIEAGANVSFLFVTVRPEGDGELLTSVGGFRPNHIKPIADGVQDVLVDAALGLVRETLALAAGGDATKH